MLPSKNYEIPTFRSLKLHLNNVNQFPKNKTFQQATSLLPVMKKVAKTIFTITV